MRLQFCGAARTVTGSNFLLDTTKGRILVDCGLFQGSRELEERNYRGFDYDPREIDWVLLTHAHIDHSGLLPRFCRLGFHGDILATKATVDLANILLPDSGYIHEREAHWENKKRRRQGLLEMSPLYTAEDAKLVEKHLIGVEYDEMIQLNRYIRVRFRDAGHILGSAMIELWVTDGRKEIGFVFSGDVGRKQMPILRDPSVIDSADVLVVESTYGTRLHEDEETKIGLLSRILNQTMDRGGKLVIPAFSVGRTQEIIYFLDKLLREKKIPQVPVILDSPLAISATEIFQAHPECYDEETHSLLRSGNNPLNIPGLRVTRELEESKLINEMKEPAIIISASGMCNAGRIKHHLLHQLPKPESTILFVGFQAEGTLGRRIRDGAEVVKIFDEEVPVKANVHAIGAFSAHADRDELLRWYDAFERTPERVFVVHGDEEVSVRFAEILAEHRQGAQVEAPEANQSFDLEMPRDSAVGFTRAHPADSMKSDLAVQERQLQKRSRGVQTTIQKMNEEILRWSESTSNLEELLVGFAVVSDDTLKELFKSVEEALRSMGITLSKILSQYPESDDVMKAQAMETFFGKSKEMQEILEELRSQLVSDLDSVGE